MTDDELRQLWRSKGGSFHGPHIETGTMPEAELLLWLRELTNQPTILFDGFEVLQAIDSKARARTSAENVSDVLDAVVRLMRSNA